MKIIRNNIIPVKGFRAINLFGILFVRGNATINGVDMNHESIHSRQILEVIVSFYPIWIAICIFSSPWIALIIMPFSFYILYVLEWIVRLIQFRNANEAYRNISFEREAYTYQSDLSYLEKRKPLAWVKFIK